LRARPEPTQLEHLSDASFFGKLLVLPANVRLGWKVIARYKHSSLFGLVISNEGKEFYNIDTRRLEKICQIFQRMAFKVAKSKKAKISTTKLNFKARNIYIKPLLKP
jgi:hypothetical protein